MAARSGTQDASSPVELKKILLMGLRKSGKTSIQKVVFENTSPHDTVFLESTVKLGHKDVVHNSFIKFQVWDFPGQIDYMDKSSNYNLSEILDNCGAIVFVMDSQIAVDEAQKRLIETIVAATNTSHNSIWVEVFVHKVDSMTEHQQQDLYRRLNKAVQEEVNTRLESNTARGLKVNFYLTSIYDHSIFEAFSRVVQRLIPQVDHLGSLLDMFISASRVERAFLFDASKIYVASDTGVFERSTYELCFDSLDLLIELSQIYSEPPAEGGNAGLNGHGGRSSGPISFDAQSHSVVSLSNGKVLVFKEVSPSLIFVGLLKEEQYDSSTALIDYNISLLRRAINEIFMIRV